MRSFLIALLLTFTQSAVLATSDVVISQRIDLPSKVMGQDWPVYISLPGDYHKQEAHYPVLYVLDGLENIRQVVGAVDVLTRTGDIPPIIVVGIDSVDRQRDFTFSQRIKGDSRSGNADNFLKFIAEEAIPYIDGRYRSNSFRIVEGHSLGGLFAMYALMERPELFDAQINIAPSLWWDEFAMLKRAKTFFPNNSQLDTVIYFAIGEKDGWGMRQELKSLVETMDKVEGLKMRYVRKEFADEGHMSAPLPANYHGLRYIFSDIAYPKKQWDNFSSKDFLEHEARVKQKYGDLARQTGEQYSALAGHLHRQGDLKGAIIVYRQMADQYPDIGLYRQWLAEALELNNSPKMAAENYLLAANIMVKRQGNKSVEPFIQRAKLLRQPVVLSDAELLQYAGVFDYQGKEIKLLIENKLLVRSVDSGNKMYLVPEGDGVFYVKGDQVKYHFEDLSQGKANALTIHYPYQPSKRLLRKQ